MPGDEGTIDEPLGRDPANRKKISTRARKSRSAVTHYSLEKRYAPFSLLRIRLETGRTHQIRVHLAEKGHPVVGDILYGGRKHLDLPPRLQSEVKALQRPFLHSRRLEFCQPETGNPISVEADLPGELREFLNRVSAFCE
jgi:23S rRNA pseudouridine1911/1915/1917 synthase